MTAKVREIKAAKSEKPDLLEKKARKPKKKMDIEGIRPKSGTKAKSGQGSKKEKKKDKAVLSTRVKNDTGKQKKRKSQQPKLGGRKKRKKKKKKKCFARGLYGKGKPPEKTQGQSGGRKISFPPPSKKRKKIKGGEAQASPLFLVLKKEAKI